MERLETESCHKLGDTAALSRDLTPGYCEGLYNVGVPAFFQQIFLELLMHVCKATEPGHCLSLYSL